MDQKAQGTIEYLIIIAIVVVIALVVVGLLLQIMGNFGGMSESAARAAWKAGTPLAISDYSQSSTNMVIVLQNTSGQTITFDAITVASGDTNTLDQSIVAGGSWTVRVADMSQTCAVSGSKYSYPKAGITITYNTPNITGLTQVGAADIVGTCA